jgi:ATP-dependent RNA helicase RhlE
MITSFEDFKLNKQILRAIAEANYSNPTKIQQQGIPQILSGQDIVGIAQTGTGKTATYILPILMRLKYAQSDHVRCLVLVPTRELVVQVKDEFLKLGAYTDLRIVGIFGGKGTKEQVDLIKQGLDILIATPGRFMEIYLDGEIYTKALRFLVIDEADRMMDMGFMPQLRRILEVIPSRKRQNLLFSATMPQRVVELSHEFLEFPMKIEVSPQSMVAETINQQLYLVPNLKTKINLLLHLLSRDEHNHRILVFTRTKKNADNVFKYLKRKNFESVKVIHGNKGQNVRLNAIESFKKGDLKILVSTDVSARGIDVSEVSLVINFDVPVLYEDYVHRIGRTGRAGKTGLSVIFANPAEEYHVKKISELIRQEIPVAVLPESVETATTENWEKQEIARAIDYQKRKEDPSFKGAFHEKKQHKGEKKRKR